MTDPNEKLVQLLCWLLLDAEALAKTYKHTFMPISTTEARGWLKMEFDFDEDDIKEASGALMVRAMMEKFT